MILRLQQLQPDALLAIRQCTPGRSLHSSARRLAEALRDEAIRARVVRVVDPETGGLSQSGERTSQLLRQLDRSRYWLVQVKAGAWDQQEEARSKLQQQPQQHQRQGGTYASQKAGSSGNSAWSQPTSDRSNKEARRREAAELDMELEDLAIVKLVDKKEAYNKEKEKRMERKLGAKAAAANSASAHKEVEFTWSSTTHDIEHKLKTLQTHLRKRGVGARATVEIRAKPGHGRTGGMEADEKNALIQRVDDFLCTWPEDAADDGEGETLYHAKRTADIEWKKGGTTAIVNFQVVKGRKPVV